MKANEVGLKIKFFVLGEIEQRFIANAHMVKSLAGELFHMTKVESVCVFSNDGAVKLYLRKLPTHDYIREYQPERL